MWDYPNRLSLDRERVAGCTNVSDHHGLNHRLGDRPGGRPANEKVRSGAASNIICSNKHFNRSIRPHGYRTGEVGLYEGPGGIEIINSFQNKRLSLRGVMNAEGYR